MAALATGALRAFNAQLARIGQTIIYRRVTRMGVAPNFALHPPSQTNLIVHVAAASGANTVSLSAPSGQMLTGYLATGDRLQFDNDPGSYLVQSAIFSNQGIFTAIPIQPSLQISLAIGQSCTLMPISDTSLKAWVRELRADYLAGSLIETEDMVLRLSGDSLSDAPMIGDQIIFENRQRAVTSVTANRIGDTVIYYDIHAR